MALIDENGYQYFLLPLTHIYISQDENGDYSHQGMLAIDFLGWNDSGRVYQCDYYAPCDCTCVAKGSQGDWVAWESDAEVRCADGSTQYMCWVQVHDDNPFPVGTKKKQGEVIGHTGTTGNVTGDHLHLNIAKGKWNTSGWTSNSQGTSHLRNEQSIPGMMYITEDTKIVMGGIHYWVRIGDVRPTSSSKKKKGYKFILFNKRRRMI